MTARHLAARLLLTRQAADRTSNSRHLPPPPPLPAQLVLAAQRHVVARFWDLAAMLVHRRHCAAGMALVAGQLVTPSSAGMQKRTACASTCSP